MIPLKLETLLKGRVVESDRVEYKRGWNPSETITTICAYANDFNNTNGGYIVIGIESENGRPLLPPTGLNENRLDEIQQEIFQYCNLIMPRYIPKIEIHQYQDMHVLYLWCSAGDEGPYSAPENVVAKNKQRDYWIKPASVKTKAKGSELSELFDKFNSVAFDDRVSRTATMDCIRRGYLEDYLRDSDSSLVIEMNNRPIEGLLLSLEVANNTDAGVVLRNIGVLMFAERPDKFIPCTQIDLVHFHTLDAEGSDEFTEKTFYGPIQKQVRDALHYIDTTIITKKVVKIEGQAESESYFNYPYNALEEILVNAVFHKSYRDPDPIEIRIYVDCIKILNYPGPELWIDMEKFAEGKIISRKYRNRRIGEFFQEIELSEKKSTGITKILRVLKQNGSPPPEFETDPGRHYMIATIRMREGFEVREVVNEQINEQISEQISEQTKRHSEILAILIKNPSFTLNQLSDATGLTVATLRREMKILKETNKIKRIGSNKTGHWEVVE